MTHQRTNTRTDVSHQALALASDAIQVWTMQTDSAEASRSVQRDAWILSGAELARASRFHSERDRARWMASRIALRRILERHLGVPARELQWTFGPHGKPSVRGVEFNCSHANGVTILALSRAGVGVDLAHASQADGIAEIAHRFLAPDEIAHCAAASPREREAAMLKWWVAKEACLKATGVGLSVEPGWVSLQLSPSGQWTKAGLGFSESPTVRVRMIESPENFVAAVAVADESHAVVTTIPYQPFAA